MTSRTTMALLMHVRLSKAPGGSFCVTDLVGLQVPASRKYGGDIEHPSMIAEDRKALREGLYHVSQPQLAAIHDARTDACLSSRSRGPSTDARSAFSPVR